MGRRSLVSLGLLVLPVAITVGVLVGLESYRTARGQTPLFVSNAVKTETYCQLAYGITPATHGQQFTLNPNQWGITEDYTGGGALCMNVTTWDNASYPTNTTAPQWTVTWEFPPGPPTEPVHAFPNIQIESSAFPLKISDVANLPLNVEWSYVVGDVAGTTTDASALTAADLNSNVAVDMFIDSDPSKATSTVDAKYEVMVWLGTFGAATQPIGLALGAIATEVINGTTFNLYAGTNGLGQSVLTWAATAAVTTFEADIGPLLQGLTGHGGPVTTDYLGYVAFGSEALSAGTNVTLSVPSLQLTVVPI